MKKKLFILVWCLATFLVRAQENFIFDKVSSMREGLAAVQQNGKWGFIDKTGEIVISNKYESTWGFSEGLAWVKYKSKWGVINKNGEGVIPFNYDRGSLFHDGVSITKIGENIGFVNSKGIEITDFVYDSGTSDFRDGYAIVSMNKNDYEEIYNGVINLKGEIVMPLTTTKTYGFSQEGICIFRDLNKKSKENYGAIDITTGAVVAPAKYFMLMGFSNGLAVVTSNSATGLSYGYIDKFGHQIISPKYNYADYFSDGFACVQLNNNYGLIDTKGSIAIPIKYEKLFHFPKNEELAMVALDYYYGYIDKQDNVIIPFEYEKAQPFKEGLAWVEKDYEASIINTKGEKIISLSEYDDTHKEFSEGLLPVQKNGKWGFIDKTGKPLEIKE